MRHDRAGIFCTVVEGIRGERAKAWRLVDEVVKPNQFDQAIRPARSNSPRRAIVLRTRKV